jgi:hypothetical protein
MPRCLESPSKRLFRGFSTKVVSDDSSCHPSRLRLSEVESGGVVDVQYEHALHRDYKEAMNNTTPLIPLVEIPERPVADGVKVC